MNKPVIGRWLLWAIETAQESKQIADYFAAQAAAGKKVKFFEDIAQFFKFLDNIHELPKLIKVSGQIPSEWLKINDLWDGIITDVKEELKLDNEKAEQLVVQWMQAGKEVGKAIELTIQLVNEPKGNNS